MAANAGCSCSTTGRGRCPRKCRVRCIRSTGLVRIDSWSGCSAWSGAVSASRTASGISIARKTRQRSPSSAGMAGDLDIDAAGAAQGRVAVVDEPREPGWCPERAELVDGWREHEDDGQVDLVGATLEHGGDHVAAIGLDDTRHTPGLE